MTSAFLSAAPDFNLVETDAKLLAEMGNCGGVVFTDLQFQPENTSWDFGATTYFENLSDLAEMSAASLRTHSQNVASSVVNLMCFIRRPLGTKFMYHCSGVCINWVYRDERSQCSVPGIAILTTEMYDVHYYLHPEEDCYFLVGGKAFLWGKWLLSWMHFSLYFFK